MKITNIKIKNFRGIVSADTQVSSRGMFLTGFNASGKSSVLDAVRMALFGAVRDANGKAYKLDALVPNPNAPSMIALTVELGNGDYPPVFELTWKRDGGKTDFEIREPEGAMEGSPDAQRRDLFRLAGVDYARAEIAANAKSFLFSRDIVEPLQSMDAAKVDPDAVRDYAAVHGFEGVFPLYVDQIEIDMATVPGLRAFGEHCKSERLICHRSIQEAKAKCAGDLPELPMVPDGSRAYKVADMEKLIAGVRTLESERAALASKRSAALDTMKRLDCKVIIEEHPAKIAALESKYDECREEEKAAAAEIATFQSERSAALAKSAQGDSGAESDIRRKIACIESGTCECLGLKFMGGAKGKAAMDAASAELQKQLATVTSGDVKSDQSDAAKDIREKIESFKKVEAAKRERASTIYREIADLRTELTKAQTAIDNDPGDADELDAQLSKMDERIQRAQSAADVLLAHTESKELRDHLDELQDTHRMLDAAVKAFDAGEFFSTLDIGDSDVFTGVNAVLAPYGFELGIEFEGKDAIITIKSESHAALPAIQCSKGEQLLATLALALEFGKNAIAIVDDADALDGHNKRIVKDAMESSAATGVGTLLCAGAWSQPKLPADMDALRKAFEPTDLVFISDGHVIG